MIMTLTDEIKKRSVHVDAAINELLPVTHPEELYKASRYLVDAGGKRLRPAVLILAAEAVGSDLESVLPAAVAVELVHNFTLIHDDIMDKDDIRRGMPAVHTIWGEDGAILAGDTLYSKAFEILSKVENEPLMILRRGKELQNPNILRWWKKRPQFFMQLLPRSEPFLEGLLMRLPMPYPSMGAL